MDVGCNKSSSLNGNLNCENSYKCVSCNWKSEQMGFTRNVNRTNRVFSGFRFQYVMAVFSCVFVYVLLFLQTCQGFNLDTLTPQLIRSPGDPGGYFGYSVAMINKDVNTNWLVIGAPRDTNSYLNGTEKPGTIYKCTIETSGAVCSQVQVEGNTDRDSATFDGRTRIFDHGQDNQWLGASLDVQKDQGIITCASRWYNRYYVAENYFFMNGLCYQIPLDFSPNNIRKIPALVDGQKQTIKVNNVTKLNYGMGSLGSSVHYTRLGEDLILGAPGLRTWTGGFIDIRQSQAYMTHYDSPHATEVSEMAGYALSSGIYFGDGYTYFAVGAPRDHLVGKVFLYRRDKTTFIFENADVFLDGTEGNRTMPVNGYFGAALCSVDVNHDGLEDLLVGAPFYSRAGPYMEEGLVLVYLGQEQPNFDKPPIVLTGSNSLQARFGSSIASLGDINKDNYNDVVIGAPYEDEMQGSIYIYNGCEGGIWPHYSQRVPASKLDPGLRAFGISLSRPVDMNDDGVNDIAVGAYLSDTAVLMYGQPVINMDIYMIKSKVDLIGDLPTCTLAGTETSCFTLDVCFLYVVRAYPMLTVSVTITLDLYLGDYYRIAWQETNTNQLTKTLRISSTARKCLGEQIVGVKSRADLVTPVLIQAQYNVENIQGGAQIRPTMNSFDGSRPQQPLLIANKRMEFKKKCPDNICNTDLHVEASATYEKTDGFFIIGTQSLSVDIKVSKTGDPSYATNMYIAFPKSVNFQKVQKESGDTEISCNFIEAVTDESDASDGEEENINTLTFLQQKMIPEISDDEIMLICSLGNPIYNDTGVEFKLLIQVPEDTTEMELPFRLNVTTLSTELALADNTLTVTVPVRYKVSTKFSGVSRPSHLTIYDKESQYPVDHVFELKNDGPSPIPVSKLTVQYPQVQKSGKPQLHLNKTSWSCRLPCSIHCAFPDTEFVAPVVHASHAGPSYSVDESPDSDRVGEKRKLSDVKLVDCSSGGCSRYECTLTNIPPRESAVISMEYAVHKDLLQVVAKGGPVTIKTDAYIRFEEKHRMILESTEHSTSVSTDIIPATPPPKPVAWWIILVSILGGILLIALLMLLLWKLGFFKRKQLEQMEKRKKEEGEKMLEEEPGDDIKKEPI